MTITRRAFMKLCGLCAVSFLPWRFSVPVKVEECYPCFRVPTTIPAFIAPDPPKTKTYLPMVNR